MRKYKFRKFFKKIVCAVFGHKFNVAFFYFPGENKVKTGLYCIRCNNKIVVKTTQK